MRRVTQLLVCLVLPLVPACGGDTAQPVPPPAPPPPAPVASVTVTPGISTLVPEQTVQLTAVTRDAGGNVLNGRPVAWTSTPSAAASVSATGLVTGLASGAAVITATSEGRNGTANIAVADGGFVLPAGTAFTAGGGRVAIEVPAGAVGAGTPITVTALTTPPPHPDLIPGTAWSLGPDGTTFAQPVTVRLTWLAAQLPAGAVAEQIRVHRFDGTAWVPLATGSVNVATRTASGTTTAFSPFVLIELPSNPLPVLSSLAPTSVIASSPGLTLTVSGTGFLTSSEVRWNGAARPTTFQSATALTAQITATDIATAGDAAVTVFSPTPGGGTTASLTFTVLPPIAAPTTFTVTTTADAGAGSLRQALLDANAGPAADLIHFNIPGAGPHTIQPLSALPAITDPVTIDGLTQPGANCTTWPATLRIELRGSNAGPGVHGLTLSGGSATVRGLVINGFVRGAGIRVASDANTVACNYLGTDVTGTMPSGTSFSRNENGVLIDGGDGNTIGGTTPSARNLISGSYDHVANHGSGVGVHLRGGATANVIAGNFIGTNVTGSASLENGNSGVHIGDAPGTVIGGADHDAGVCNRSCNLISGNDDFGIEILQDGGNNTVIQGNFIGTNLTGSAPVSNGQQGIIVDAGTSSTGTSGHVIGGASDPGVCSRGCNLISGNTSQGIRIDDRALKNMTIQGNFVGTDITGMAAVPNGGPGIKLDGADHQIGGTAPGLGNLISGNGNRGIDVGADNTVVEGNHIGTAIDGVSPLGNGGGGILVTEVGKRIGGTAAGQGNTIAYNGGAGILHSLNIGAPENARNSFLGNSIFANGGLGIDLTPSGVTPNDLGDGDEGANRLQNFPVLSAATLTGTLSVTGTLNSTASTIFRIEFFANNALDPSGYGEGQTYLGFAVVTTDAGGNASIAAVLPSAGVTAGKFITATATNPGGSTSEFSAGIVVP